MHDCQSGICARFARCLQIALRHKTIKTKTDMSVAGILKAVFGSKSDRDMKQVKPYLNKILAAYETIDKLSDDDLRAHSAALREKLVQVEAPFERRAEEIREEMEKDIITEANGVRVYSSQDLVLAVDKCGDGEPMELVVYRYNYDSDGNVTGGYEELEMTLQLEILD